jgi:hypothetical protein
VTCKRVQARNAELRGLEREFQTTKLKREGRLQFFFHCRQSSLPIRDVVGRKKKEPHIEKNAENYCKKCYQNNIIGFLKSREKYLFLFTKCANRKPPLHEFYGERLIVGYITKERWLIRGNHHHFAVQGFTKIVSFEDAFPLSKFGPRARYWRMKTFDERETSVILEHLAPAKNIRTECIREISRWNQTGFKKDSSCK